MNLKPALKAYHDRVLHLIRHQPRKVYQDFAPSFSQEGEDMVLRRIFGTQNEGFYVDVGANDPIKFSNTYYFYLEGWRGINIDAMPGSMDLFNKMRPRDINIESAISDSREVLTYYAFNEPALNGFSKELSFERSQIKPYKIIFEREIQTVPLSEVLDRYLPDNQTIDFLTVDVEGLDFEVLRSNDWEKYRPLVVLAEDLEFSSFERMGESRIVTYLGNQGYQLFCKTVNTLIFKDNR